MTRAVTIRKSRIYTARPTWIANCSLCWWYRSYPSWPIAFHAAGQHIRHWTAKERERSQSVIPEVPF